MSARDFSNTSDIIDSRDIIARIEELQAEIADLLEAGDDDDAADARAELAPLEALAAEAASYAEDWQHGEALIRDSYFEEHARQLAEDIGAIHADTPWPARHIDWEAAAEELQQDYTSVNYDGVTYWIR